MPNRERERERERGRLEKTWNGFTLDGLALVSAQAFFLGQSRAVPAKLGRADGGHSGKRLAVLTVPRRNTQKETPLWQMPVV